jgi:ankyrin repeat protein
MSLNTINNDDRMVSDDEEVVTPPINERGAEANRQLLAAAQRGDVVAIQAAVRDGGDVNCCSTAGYALVIVAAIFNAWDVVEKLTAMYDVSADTRVNTLSAQYEGYSLLHFACRRGNPRAVQQLVAEGAHVNRIDGKLQTPLQIVPVDDEDAYSAICDTLRSNGALETLAGYGGELIHQVCCDPVALQQYISHVPGRDLNTISPMGTPLCIACRRHAVECVRILIGAGADVNGCNCSAIKSPLCIASANDDDEIIHILLTAGAIPDCTSPSVCMTFPLYEACARGAQTVVQHMLDRDADINAQCATRGIPGTKAILVTALYPVCCNGNEDLAITLLNAGINPNCAQDGGGVLAAYVKGHKSLVKTLIVWGVALDERDSDNKSLAYYAVAANDARMIKALIQADCDCSGYADKIPIVLAMNRKYKSVLSKLLNAGYKVPPQVLALAPPEMAAFVSDYDIVPPRNAPNTP